METGCFYVVRAEIYLEENWGGQVSSVSKAAKRGTELVKLKNLRS
jgi:hypothetical protein